MYLHNPTFDIDELLKTNYHIHTSFSRCAKPEMKLADIVKTAEKAGLAEIALTDHIHPGETWKLKRNLPDLREQLSKIQTNVKVYIGAELSAYGEKKYTLKHSDFDLDYRLYAHNHYHMYGWEQPEDNSPFGYKEHCKKVLAAVIKSGKADCMAHPFNDYYIVREFGERYGFSLGDITSLWTENELGDILTLGKNYNVAWEINTKSCHQNPDFIKKFWNTGKEAGVCFNLGTDAHTLNSITTKGEADYLKNLLL